ncbi:MAG: TlpA disulfide reductase family protein [Candidatus Omnitrophica bacterium]|nr:TlpA disulfide reductase family protein [Candidatus Omnitrophota bacterium]
MRIAIKGAVIFLTLALILVSGFISTASAGDIILNDLESKPVNLSKLAGKPSILFFWTTWCPYCRTELKSLDKMYSQMGKEGLAVFAVNVGEPAVKVERFLKDHALSIRVLLDRDGQAAENYEILGIPTYIFINKEGRVVSVEHSLPADYRDLLLK